MNTQKKCFALLLAVCFALSSLTGLAPIAHAAETVTLNGVLICANCKQAAPAQHTVDCCLMDA